MLNRKYIISTMSLFGKKVEAERLGTEWEVSVTELGGGIKMARCCRHPTISVCFLVLNSFRYFIPWGCFYLRGAKRALEALQQTTRLLLSIRERNPSDNHFWNIGKFSQIFSKRLFALVKKKKNGQKINKTHIYHKNCGFILSLFSAPHDYLSRKIVQISGKQRI